MVEGTISCHIMHITMGNSLNLYMNIKTALKLVIKTIHVKEKMHPKFHGNLWSTSRGVTSTQEEYKQ